MTGDHLIRPALVDDVEPMLEIYGPVVRDSIISFETEPPTPDEFARRLKNSHLWLVCEDTEGISGYAYAGPFHKRAAYRWSAEVSVYVHPRAQRFGVGRALTEALLAQLADAGFVNVFAGVALPNDASVRLFESLGFEEMALQKEVGYKFERWIDVGWWQKHLRDRTIPPPELTI